MSDTMATSAPKRRGRPIPNWYYAAGAGGLFVVYFLVSRYRKNAATAAAAASSTTAATLPATQTPVMPAASYGNANDLSALLPYLTNLQGATSVTPSATTGDTAPPPVVSTEAPAPAPNYGTLQASGYTGGGANYSGIGTQAQLQAIIANNIQRYYEPVAGVFMPITGKEAPNTPQFIRNT